MKHKQCARFLLCFFLLLVIIFPSTRVFADVGPKASLTILCSNMPATGLVYVDLLIPDPYPDGFTLSGLENYNPVMVNILQSYIHEGWRPALVCGTGAPLWGDILCEVQPDGSATMEFSYFGVPDRFRIIVVTENGDITVSNIVEKTVFQSTVEFDYPSATATELPAWRLTAVQFIETSLITLVLEGLILLLFRFRLKENWIPFLIVNVATQLLLYFAITWAAAVMGTVFAVVAYLVTELLILGIEMIVFALALKPYKKGRRILYAFTANTVSFVIGILVYILLS